MGGGGGSSGGTNISDIKGGFRSPSEEKGTFNNWYQNQFNNLQDLENRDPLLSKAFAGAQNFWGQLPSMLGQFPGFQNELSADQSQIQGYQGQLGDLSSQMAGLFGQIPGLQSQLGSLSDQAGQGFGSLSHQLGVLLPGI